MAVSVKLPAAVAGDDGEEQTDFGRSMARWFDVISRGGQAELWPKP